MKTKLFTVLVIAAGLGALVARAQSNDAAGQAAAPQPAQVVYSPRLPSAAELSSAAAAQGLTVDKIVQSASQMTLVYHTANGQTHTVAYQLLPTAGPVDHTAPAPAPETHAALDATVAQPASPGPQVVYAQAPATQTVVYSAPAPAPAYYSPYYYPYYSPYYYAPYYAPVAFSVGFGFGYYGGYYGHYHGGGGYYHGGGGHGGHH